MDIFDNPPLLIELLAWYLGISILVVFVLILNTFSKMRGYPKYVREHDQKFFPDVKISSKGFYKELESKIDALGLPDIKYGPLSLFQRNIFTGTRLYFRVKRYETMFDICAAPYGNNFFVSWWLGDKVPLSTHLSMYLPIIGRFVRKDLETRTYYAMDTEAMFKGAIKYAVEQAIEEFKTPTGIARMKISETAEQMVNKEPEEEEEDPDDLIGNEWKRGDATV